MLFKELDKYRQIGLLILRLGLGLMFIIHGYPKIIGGPDKWLQLGGVMALIGIKFAPAFWGFMAAFAEFIGGILLIIGFFFRPACALLVFTMIMATIMHLVKGDGLNIASHAIEAGITFFSLILIGPGDFSLDYNFPSLKTSSKQ
jgi:putative oxidoreductase